MTIYLLKNNGWTPYHGQELAGILWNMAAECYGQIPYIIK